MVSRPSNLPNWQPSSTTRTKPVAAKPAPRHRGCSCDSERVEEALCVVSQKWVSVVSPTIAAWRDARRRYGLITQQAVARPVLYTAVGADPTRRTRLGPPTRRPTSREAVRRPEQGRRVRRALTPYRRTVDSRGQQSELRDLFLCPAWDDRRGVATELNDVLEAEGVSVWFSEKDILLGQPFMREIDRGLAKSRAGLDDEGMPAAAGPSGEVGAHPKVPRSSSS